MRLGTNWLDAGVGFGDPERKGIRGGYNGDQRRNCSKSLLFSLWSMDSVGLWKFPGAHPPPIM